MPRDLRWSHGGGAFLMSDVPLYMKGYEPPASQTSNLKHYALNPEWLADEEYYKLMDRAASLDHVIPTPSTLHPDPGPYRGT